MQSKFGTSNDQGHHKISLKWQKGVPSDSALAVFDNIKIGYLLAINREAKEN